MLHRDDRFEENEENHVWASRFPTDSIVKSWVTTSFGRIAVVGRESYLVHAGLAFTNARDTQFKMSRIQNCLIAGVKNPFENHRRLLQK